MNQISRISILFMMCANIVGAFFFFAHGLYKNAATCMLCTFAYAWFFDRL